MPILEGGFGLIQSDSSRRLTIPRDVALTYYQDFAVVETDEYANRLGLYGHVMLNRDLKAQFLSFTTPKHLWSKRANGCSWNPKGGVRMNVETFPTCPIEYDGEQCPDAFYGTCFEQLFNPDPGTGRTFNSPESLAVLDQMVTQVNRGLGNSFFDLYHFANHPFITTSDTNAWYDVALGEWEDYTDQMLSGECGGLVTQLDALFDMGHRGYTRSLSVNNTTGAYTGEFVDDIAALIGDCGVELRTAMRSGVTINGVRRYPVILVTSDIFDNYRDWIRAMAPTNELAYVYHMLGTDGVTIQDRNILMYDSMPVIRWDANDRFDAITGAKSHRIAIVMPGNFGVLHDVQSLDQFGGMGMVIEQSQRLQDKGKIYMTANLRWGAGIANVDFAAMAKTVLHPLGA